MSAPLGANVLTASDNAQQQDPKMTDLIAVQRIAGWEKLKALVLDSVSSPITKRVYNMALDEFMQWFQQAPRPGFTKATVSAWRVSLEVRGLGSSSIIIRMSMPFQRFHEEESQGGTVLHNGTGIQFPLSKQMGLKL